VVAAFLIHTNDLDPSERRIAWPPRLRADEVHAGSRATGIVGLAPRIGVYQLFARLGPHTETFVSVYFGRPHPTSLQLRAANERLAFATP
jgi:hypothetical protein